MWPGAIEQGNSRCNHQQTNNQLLARPGKIQPMGCGKPDRPRHAVIAPVRPDDLDAAVRTGRRAIHLRCRTDRLEMLLKAGDAGYNPLHRLGSFLYPVVSRASHDSKGVPAYLPPVSSRLPSGKVPTIARNVLGMLTPPEPHGERDVTPVDRQRSACTFPEPGRRLRERRPESHRHLSEGLSARCAQRQSGIIGGAGLG